MKKLVQLHQWLAPPQTAIDAPSKKTFDGCEQAKRKSYPSSRPSKISFSPRRQQQFVTLVAQAHGSVTSKMKKAFQLRHVLPPTQTADTAPSKNQPLMAANKPKGRGSINAKASFRLQTYFFGQGNSSHWHRCWARAHGSVTS